MMEDHELLTIIKQAIEEGASDLHLSVNFPPTLRKNGELIPLDMPNLKPKDTEMVAREIIPSQQVDNLKTWGECDFSYSLHGLGRFRVSVFRQRGTVSIVMRIIDRRIPDLSDLGLPHSVENFAEKKKGLVLVAGPSGCGKSTTMAALLEKINMERAGHIITLEDPVEFLHTHKKSIVNQREIGQDSLSFAQALRSSIRQNPDVIFLGEMRDLETIETAFAAAEMGCLVFGAFNSPDVFNTIERIIESFPYYQQQQIRFNLASALEGIIIQRLLPTLDGSERIVAAEILMGTSQVKTLIKEGKIEELYEEMEKGKDLGMQTMDSHLRELVEKNLVSPEAAMVNAVKSDFFKELI